MNIFKPIFQKFGSNNTDLFSKICKQQFWFMLNSQEAPDMEPIRNSLFRGESSFFYVLSLSTTIKRDQSRAICWTLLIYGLATVSRIDTIIGLFCRISSVLQVSFAKETYIFIDPTNQSHPISASHFVLASHLQERFLLPSHLCARTHWVRSRLVNMYTRLFALVIMYVSPVQEKWRGQRAFSRKFESVPSLFLFVLKSFVCTVPPGTVLITVKSKFVILKLWQLVVFCTCRILPKELNFVEYSTLSRICPYGSYT